MRFFAYYLTYICIKVILNVFLLHTNQLTFCIDQYQNKRFNKQDTNRP